MKTKRIAAAALIPAGAAGIALSIMPFAHAASHPTTARHPRVHTASASAGTAASLTAGAHPAKTGAAHARSQAARHATQRVHRSATPTSTSQAAQQPAAVSQAPVTAGESAFEQCVSWRESGNNPTDPDGLFGILPYVWQSLGYSGTAGQAPVSVQKQAFDRLYAMYGTQPWAPSDGC